MPRYYFHIHGSNGSIPDEEGMDLPDVDTAKRLARMSAQELLTVIVGEDEHDGSEPIPHADLQWLLCVQEHGLQASNA